MNNKPHGFYQFDFSVLTNQEIANMSFFLFTKITPFKIHIHIIDMMLKTCNQFSGFTKGDFIKEDGGFVDDEKMLLLSDITFELFSAFLDYFNLSLELLDKNEWYKDGIFIYNGTGVEDELIGNIDFKNKEQTPPIVVNEDDIIVKKDSYSAFNDLLNEMGFDLGDL